MEKVKKTVLWVIGISLISVFFIYVNQIVVPSILVLIVGTILLPPINQKIEDQLGNKEKINKYEIIRNIMVIICIIILGANVPTQNEVENKNDSYSDVIINKTKVDESVSLTITETNGNYIGERVDGKKEGYGKYEWDDGAIYEGNFSNDKINGEGKLTIPQKGTFEGTFVNGKKNRTRYL